MEIRNITAFVRVAETQSFSRAAEQLGYSQSAVTMQIKQLEDALGAQLFERMAGM
ncbi:MAG: LysR family transcriptional regulator [Acutalibacteraceae bacterium]